MSSCGRYQPVLPVALERGDDSRVELSETPFFPQKRYQCGPASLATVLAVNNIDVTPGELAGRVFLPERKGSLQVELVAAVRAYDLIPFVIEPSLVPLLAELKRGKPVLVLQNLGTVSYPRYHYAVVIGYDPVEDTIILRSGTVERLILKASRFLESWHRAGMWAMVVLAPGEIPALPDPDRFLASVMALEEIGKFETALAGYKSVLQLWPDLYGPVLGMGNCYYGLEEFDLAEKTYRQLIEKFPRSLVGYNNLAHVLGILGNYEEALSILEKGEALTLESDPARELLQQTRDEIVIRRALDENGEDQ